MQGFKLPPYNQRFRFRLTDGNVTLLHNIHVCILTAPSGKGLVFFLYGIDENFVSQPISVLGNDYLSAVERFNEIWKEKLIKVVNESPDQ